MSNARIGWGGKVLLATDNTEATLTELGEVVSCTFPSDQADEVDVTHLQSPGRRKEFISGLVDGGEVTVTMNYDPGSATDLLLTDAAETGDTRKVRFEIPDTTGTGTIDWNITTSCFIKKYAPDTMETANKITATATLRITGAREQGTGVSGS
jgi:hypothetical protein